MEPKFEIEERSDPLYPFKGKTISSASDTTKAVPLSDDDEDEGKPVVKSSLGEIKRRYRR